MQMRQLIQWIYQASAPERAETAALLARSYISGEGSAEDRKGCEATLTVLLDDEAPLVRKALATALAPSAVAPHHIILALAQDQVDVASVVLQQSPLLMEAELVDVVAAGQPRLQLAVAERAQVSAGLAAALAEVGSAEACAALLNNGNAKIAVFSIMRMAERLGHEACVRDALLERDDLPVAVRQHLITHLSNVLGGYLNQKDWMTNGRIADVTREALDRATLVLAESDAAALPALIEHLSATGQLTPALLFRALCVGHGVFFEEALVQLSQVPRERVYALVQDRGSNGFQALYKRAGLPSSAFAAFRAALDALAETPANKLPAGAAHFSRSLLERIYERYHHNAADETDPLLALLRRFMAEAAREEARRYAVDHIQGFAAQRKPRSRVA